LNSKQKLFILHQNQNTEAHLHPVDLQHPLFDTPTLWTFSWPQPARKQKGGSTSHPHLHTSICAPRFPDVAVGFSACPNLPRTRPFRRHRGVRTGHQVVGALVQSIEPIEATQSTSRSPSALLLWGATANPRSVQPKRTAAEKTDPSFSVSDPFGDHEQRHQREFLIANSGLQRRRQKRDPSR
jgi:hypothetical protein